MKSLVKFVGAALVGAVALLATPAAWAQVGVNIAIGAPAWGPQVPSGTQYYYIPEIDGYYDLYNQQYIVFQDGYWVPVPQLYGYDPYQFHPIIVDYRGPQPWLRVDYYRQRYAYQPYRHYGPGRNGYYNGGYGYGNSYGRPRYDNRGYSNGRGYGNNDNRGGNRGYNDRGAGHDNRDQRPGGYNTPRGNQPPQAPQPPQPGQSGGHGNDRDSFGPGQGSQGQQSGGRSPNDGGGMRSNNGGHGRS